MFCGGHRDNMSCLTMVLFYSKPILRSYKNENNIILFWATNDVFIRPIWHSVRKCVQCPVGVGVALLKLCLLNAIC